MEQLDVTQPTRLKGLTFVDLGKFAIVRVLSGTRGALFYGARNATVKRRSAARHTSRDRRTIFRAELNQVKSKLIRKQGIDSYDQLGER